MSAINISKELGEDIVTREHGERLRHLVEARLDSPPVVIDFGGLEITSVSFFDEAFGQLVLQRGEGFLEAIQLTGISPFDKALVQDIVHSRAQERVKRAARR